MATADVESVYQQIFKKVKMVSCVGRFFGTFAKKPGSLVRICLIIGILVKANCRVIAKLILTFIYDIPVALARYSSCQK
jgi:hypothetical protein